MCIVACCIDRAHSSSKHDTSTITCTFRRRHSRRHAHCRRCVIAVDTNRDDTFMRHPFRVPLIGIGGRRDGVASWNYCVGGAHNHLYTYGLID
jgi:hypothetical protein